MSSANPTPIRAGVFDVFAQAEQAVDRLLAAGFTKDEISVVASNESIQQHFSEFRHEASGEHTEEGMAAGSATGMAIGTFAALGVATATGVGLVAAGALAAVGFGVGSFAGAMTTRGMEDSLADFYDQALTGGDILVAADLHATDPENTARLETAAGILAECGAKPIALPEG